VGIAPVAIDAIAEGAKHIVCDSTGRLATVISTGPTASPLCRRRRRAADGRNAWPGAPGGSSGGSAICVNGKQSSFQWIESAIARRKTKGCK
jgi:hypothetical protein